MDRRKCTGLNLWRMSSGCTSVSPFSFFFFLFFSFFHNFIQPFVLAGLQEAIDGRGDVTTLVYTLVFPFLTNQMFQLLMGVRRLWTVVNGLLSKPYNIFMTCPCADLCFIKARQCLSFSFLTVSCIDFSPVLAANVIHTYTNNKQPPPTGTVWTTGISASVCSSLCHPSGSNCSKLWLIINQEEWD